VASLSLFWRSSPDIIRSGVTNALALASEHGFASVAMPLIGSGTGGVPRSIAQPIIIEAASRSAFRGRVVVVVHRDR
jgi:O-acetyl-ADP-ribose deacetylase (regulator of RNase III)